LEAGEFGDRDVWIRARQAIGAIGITTRDQILEPKQKVVELQPIPGRKERGVVDVVKNDFDPKLSIST
jgi:hypothetical protein